jgi:hypothetical protein
MPTGERINADMRSTNPSQSSLPLPDRLPQWPLPHARRSQIEDVESGDKPERQTHDGARFRLDFA